MLTRREFLATTGAAAMAARQLKELREKMAAFRERTRDPWLLGRKAEHGTGY